MLSTQLRIINLLERNLEELKEPKVVMSLQEGDLDKKIIYADEAFINGYKKAIQDVVKITEASNLLMGNHK